MNFPLNEPAPATERRFRDAVLRWYRRHHRKLPWRAQIGKTPDPYHVLVSETMLQQTQVATVVGYFHRFIAAWPTISALAAADEQEVLRLWQGLGYYRRARNLLQAARAIQHEHRGRIPSTVDELRKLPGIGPYTAGAVASIAFAKPEPVVDGNIARLLGRLLAVDEPVDRPRTQKLLWETAGRLVSTTVRKRTTTPGDFNQALMELGGGVCTARSPACLLCPVTDFCAAHAADQPERYPPPKARTAQQPVTHHIIALCRDSRRLFVQRPASGLWASMWQMPTLELPRSHMASDNGAAASQAAARSNDQSSREPNGDACDAEALREWVREQFGLQIDRPRQLARFSHLTSHRRITFFVWQATVQAGRLRGGDRQYRRLDQLDDLPLANPQRRAVAFLLESAEGLAHA